MNYLFFATEWSSNGTNDLLVVDGDSYEVIDCISGALFGFRVGNNPQNVCLENRIEPTSKRILKYTDCTAVKEITIFEAIKSRACNPLDPSGNKIFRQLLKYTTVNNNN